MVASHLYQPLEKSTFPLAMKSTAFVLAASSSTIVACALHRHLLGHHSVYPLYKLTARLLMALILYTSQKPKESFGACFSKLVWVSSMSYLFTFCVAFFARFTYWILLMLFDVSNLVLSTVCRIFRKVYTSDWIFVMQNYWVRCRYGPLTECLNIVWWFLLVKSVVADFRW